MAASRWVLGDTKMTGIRTRRSRDHQEDAARAPGPGATWGNHQARQARARPDGGHRANARRGSQLRGHRHPDGGGRQGGEHRGVHPHFRQPEGMHRGPRARHRRHRAQAAEALPESGLTTSYWWAASPSHYGALLSMVWIELSGPSEMSDVALTRASAWGCEVPEGYPTEPIWDTQNPPGIGCTYRMVSRNDPSAWR